MNVGDRTKYGARVCSVVRVDGEVVQVGVRDLVGADGTAAHWGVDPVTEKAVTRFVVYRYLGQQP